MRLRELGPKTLAKAEQITVRMEAYKIADKQRSRLVGRLEAEGQQTVNEQTKSKAISSLTNQMKNLFKQNIQNKTSGASYMQKQQGHSHQNSQNYGRNQKPNRPFRNNQDRSQGNGLQRPAGQARGNNSLNYQNQNHRQNGAYQNYNPRNPINSNNHISGGNFNRHKQPLRLDNSSQGNMNQSAWGPTNTRRAQKHSFEKYGRGLFRPRLCRKHASYLSC